MKRIPLRRDSGGCLEFLTTCAKASLIGLAAAVVAAIVGGDELRGVMLACIVFPVVFLGAMIYFTSKPKSAGKPAEIKKSVSRPARRP